MTTVAACRRGSSDAGLDDAPGHPVSPPGGSLCHGQAYGVIQLQKILQYLKEHGERLDAEIAKDIGIPLENVSLGLSQLAAKGDVIMCHTTRYTDGKTIEGMLCRVAGYMPPASPGRKPKAPA